MKKLRLQFLLPALVLASALVNSVAVSGQQTTSNTPLTRPLFDKKTVGEIRITFSTTDWVNVLDSLRIYGTDAMPATIVVDGLRYDGAMVRFRGDKSYAKGLKRNPFSIKLNSGANPGQNHQGYSAIKLSAAVRDPSMAREMLFQEIAAKYMPTPLSA